MNYEYTLVHRFRIKYYIKDLCEYMGIYSRARRKAFRRTKGVSDNINGDWSTTRPFDRVCSDTTMLKHDGKKYD